MRPVYEVKFNLREPPAFQRRLTPGEEGLGASYNRLYPEVLSEKGYLFEVLIKVYQKKGNSLLK